MEADWPETAGTVRDGNEKASGNPPEAFVFHFQSGTPYPMIPPITFPFTNSRGWFRWLNTIVSGGMPTL